MASPLGPKHPLPKHLLSNTGEVTVYEFGDSDRTRYGDAVAFTLEVQSERSDGPAVSFERHLAACDGSWSTDSYVLGSATSRRGDHSTMFALEREALKNLAPDMSVTRFSSGLVQASGQLPEVEKAIAGKLRSWCRAASSKGHESLAIAQNQAQTELTELLPHTLSRRGDIVQSWFTVKPMKVRPVQNPDGTPFVDRQGVSSANHEPVEGPTRNVAYIFDCANRTMALKAFIVYRSSGEVDSGRSFSSIAHPQPKPVIADSIGETELKAACRVAGLN